jgi:hypothetical protein
MLRAKRLYEMMMALQKNSTRNIKKQFIEIRRKVNV